jgi:hypothetical protein
MDHCLRSLLDEPVPRGAGHQRQALLDAERLDWLGQQVLRDEAGYLRVGSGIQEAVWRSPGKSKGKDALRTSYQHRLDSNMDAPSTSRSCGVWRRVKEKIMRGKSETSGFRKHAGGVIDSNAVNQ